MRAYVFCLPMTYDLEVILKYCGRSSYDLRACVDCLRSVLVPLCAVLGRSWGLCWRSRGGLGTYVGDLGPPRALGRSWAALGTLLGALGLLWAALGSLLAALGLLLAALGRILAALGPLLAGLGPLLEPMLAVLAALGASAGGPGPSWAEKSRRTGVS